jgi:5'-nucleotidase
MRILLTNDDGINAEGIRELASALAQEHEIYIAAPDRQRSAAGHSVTYFMQDNTACRADIPGVREAWAISGTPADCVYYALYGLLREKPDLVLSGINHGPNLATDCLYSGTVAAAMEAYVIGIPEAALSLCGRNKAYLKDSAEAAADLLPEIFPYISGSDCILNINFPCIPRSEMAGVRITQFDGMRNYAKKLEIIPENNDTVILRCPSTPVTMKTTRRTLEGDVTAVEQHYISITPLDGDLCAAEVCKAMKGVFQ